MDFVEGDNLSPQSFTDKANFRFQVLAIRIDFVEGDNLSLECFAVRANFRFQVLAIGMDFAEGDYLSPKCFADRADFRFHVFAGACWEIYKVTSKLQGFFRDRCYFEGNLYPISLLRGQDPNSFKGRWLIFHCKGAKAQIP